MSAPQPMMLREWKSAIETFNRRKGRSKHWEAYNTVIAELLKQLQSAGSVDELKKRYRRGNYWALQIARRIYPDNQNAWNQHLTTDVAYGYRFLELTGLKETEARADREATPAELAAQAAEEAAEAAEAGGQAGQREAGE